ncbi:MAG: ParB N-terminal domain-containing protein [Phycisphaerales bacterium]|nr:MAG: ParB N-terminal domain-containing protein [Phycisphaerales bacterium]
MRESRVANQVSKIAIDKLIAHPAHPNRMSKINFARLVRNIERTGLYEPIVVRPRDDCFQIINGHNRWRALYELGYATVDVVIWNIDEEQTEVFLATLNRLGGSDVLEKKLALLRRLNERMKARDLARFLPHTAKQIRRLAQVRSDGIVPTQSMNSLKDKCAKSVFANAQVFFLSDAQQHIVEEALSLAQENGSENTKAARNAAALTYVAKNFAEGKKKCDNEGR